MCAFNADFARQVKTLGVLALIDEGETDWKLIVIAADHPQVNEINGECLHACVRACVC
jgi:inorganic pyrophosphatase